jgi:hypothetical protein
LLLASCFAWPMAPSLEDCWILLCCAGWAGLVFRALNALSCCLMHGMVVLGMVSWLVLGSWLPCSLQLSHCRFLCHQLFALVFVPGDSVTVLQDIGWLICVLVALERFLGSSL